MTEVRPPEHLSGVPAVVWALRHLINNADRLLVTPRQRQGAHMLLDAIEAMDDEDLDGIRAILRKSEIWAANRPKPDQP